MNEELQRAIEKVKMVDLVGKRQEFRDKNPEDKLRTIIRELANNEQIIAINEEEARKVEARIEGIKDGDYLYKVQQEIRDIKKQTEKIHKENKKLEIKNDETGKNLDILENVKGNPSSVEEIHAKQDELMSLKEKIIELKKKNQSKLEEKELKQEKEKKFTEELKKLGKRVQPHSEIPQHMEKAYLQHSILSKQVKILENQLNYTENKNKKFLITQKERELEELYLNNQKERSHFQRLDDIISEQVVALRNIAQLEVRTSNKTVQEIVRSMKSNLDREEKKREITAQSHEEVANEIDKDYQALSLRKEKNLKIGLKVKGEMYSGLPLYSPGLKFRSVTTNNRNVVKRELVENRKKPMWKENKGGYEGMGSHLLKTNQHNENNNNKLYSKPLGLKKSRVAQETKRDENELSYGQSTGRSHYDKHDASKPKNSERNSHRGPQGIVKENYEQKNEEAQKEGSLELTRKAKMPLNLNINRKESDKNNEKEDILKSGNISENDNENKVNQTKKLPRENKNRSESPSPLRSSRKSSPGKRSDLEIDVEAIEREHEGVFDFNHGSNKKPQSTGKESEERTQEKNRTMNQKKKFEKTEPERQEENGDHNKTANNNEIKQSTNRSERNMELQVLAITFSF